MILQLPKPTTANERLFPKEPQTEIEYTSRLIIPAMQSQGWILSERGELFQPLFGLTAKTIDGGERTVVQGDIVLIRGTFNGRGGGVLSADRTSVGIVTIEDYAFVVKIADKHESTLSVMDIANPDYRAIILCHATDIVAKGGKLDCWECGGFGLGPEITCGPNDPEREPCPTCHGEGQFNVIWEKPCSN